MTKKDIPHDPILAILNGYLEFKKIGTWEETRNGVRGSGLTLELADTPPNVAARFLQIDYMCLDEETEQAPLLRGEPVWLRIDAEDLAERI